MKKLMLLSALSLFVFATSCTKSEDFNKAETPTVTADVEYEVVTLKELQKTFGDDIVVENGEIDENTPIYWMGGDLAAMAPEKSQCGPDIPPCSSLTGIVNSQYVPIANECCCVFAAGTICCGQNGSLLAVLVLVTPRDPNCGIVGL